MSKRALYAADPTLLFPHLADGGGYFFEIILTNPDDQAESGTISFVKSDGSPLTISVGGMQQSTFQYSMPPRGTFKLTSDGGTELQVGYATVISDNPTGTRVTGRLIFSLNGVEVSVSNAQLATEYHVFAERSSEFNSGLAIAYLGTATSDLTLILLDETGTELGRTTLNLAPNQHYAKFIDEIWDEAVPADFRGTVQVISENGAMFGMLGLRMRFATEQLAVPRTARKNQS